MSEFILACADMSELFRRGDMAPPEESDDTSPHSKIAAAAK
jgi:hypothetical protein